MLILDLAKVSPWKIRQCPTHNRPEYDAGAPFGWVEFKSLEELKESRRAIT